MYFIDSLTIAAQRAQDWDVPEKLLPLVIANEANLLSSNEAGHRRHATWD